MINSIRRGTILILNDSSKPDIAVYNLKSQKPLNVNQVQSVREIRPDNAVLLEGVYMNMSKSSSALPIDQHLRGDRFKVLMLPPDEEEYTNRMEAVDAI